MQSAGMSESESAYLHVRDRRPVDQFRFFGAFSPLPMSSIRMGLGKVEDRQAKLTKYPMPDFVGGSHHYDVGHAGKTPTFILADLEHAFWLSGDPVRLDSKWLKKTYRSSLADVGLALLELSPCSALILEI